MRSTEFGTAEAVYGEIKRRILHLHYMPGEKLSEARLVSDLKVNRSRLRTALTKLQTDGWVIVSPQSGTYVRNLSSAEIEEVLEFRLILETHVAGMAAKRITDEELATLRQAFEQFGDAATKDNIDAYVELDHMLHAAIYRAAGNELIKNTLLNLIDKVRWIRRCISNWPERNQESLGEARAILEALEERDPDRAIEAMRVHITNIILFRRQLDAASGINDAKQLEARSRRGDGDSSRTLALLD